MGDRWTRQAEAFSALKAGMEEARKSRELRQRQLKREEALADERELRRKERELRTQHTETRLRELRERERIQMDIIEERRRERCESYLMWREETRQQDMTEEARAKRARRESHELVMMRREELLARDAWALEDASMKHAVELRGHGDRISRLVPPKAPGRPEAIILDGLECVVDGRMAKVTVTLRPSKASMLAFKQVAAAKFVAEASIVQLRAALKDARHATVSHATALADALGVNPPKSLLARRVHNEHREHLLMRDVTARGCTYRFRSRFAGEVVRSARRLHWLAGSSRSTVVRGRGSPIGGSSVVDGSAPSETVGTEGWSALAAFAEVADLLEIIRSTAELVVSVEINSWPGRRQQSKGGTDVQDEERGTETHGRGVFESEGSTGWAAAILGNRLDSDESGLSSAVEDETKGSAVARTDPGDMISSPEAEHSEDDTGVVASIEEGEKQQHLRSSTQGDDVDQRGGLPPPKKDESLAAPTPVLYSTPVVPAEGPVFPSKEHRRSVSEPSKLVAIQEEGDTEVEFESSSDRDEAGMEGEGEGDDNSNAGAGPSPRYSAEKVDQSGAISDKSEHTTNNPERAGGGMTIDRAAVMARIILGPSTIEESLTVPPLSAFVLQSARRTQYADSKASAPDGVHRADGFSSSLGSATGGLGSPEMTDETLAEKYHVGNKPGNRPATSTDHQPPTGLNDVPKVPPNSPPDDETAKDFGIPDTEKLGLACAVEALILPRVRLNLTPKRRKASPSSSARRTGPRFRLDLDTPIDVSEWLSNLEVGVVRCAATVVGVRFNGYV
eukprot:g12071.t1